MTRRIPPRREQDLAAAHGALLAAGATEAEARLLAVRTVHVARTLALLPGAYRKAPAMSRAAAACLDGYRARAEVTHGP
jgi:hypothetical protein